jgi:hypothetical protein
MTPIPIHLFLTDWRYVACRKSEPTGVVRGSRNPGDVTCLRCKAAKPDAFPSPSVLPPDAEEARLWALMRPRLEVGHCPCGIPRELCTYHGGAPR